MLPIITPLIAVLLPCIVLIRSNKTPVQRPYLYSVGSFAAALAALCVEVLTIRRRVYSGDFGGIEDTIGAVVVICIGIAVVTILMNFLALAVSYADEKAPSDEGAVE